MRKILFIFALFLSQQSFAKNIELNDYCSTGINRHTHILVDENIIFHEGKDVQPSKKNQSWRKMLIQLLSEKAQYNGRKMWMNGEKFILSTVNQDGTGLKNIVSGCLPFKKDSKDAGSFMDMFKKFFGTSDEDVINNAYSEYQRVFALKLREMAIAKEGISKKSGNLEILFKSFSRGFLPNLDYGLPRVILLTGLEENPKELSQQTRVDMKNSDVYIINFNNKDHVNQEAITRSFLAHNALVKSISKVDGEILLDEYPENISYYKGNIKYSTGSYPLALRLATSKTGKIVQSWLSVQGTDMHNTGSIPLDGLLSCENNLCTYNETSDFAKIYFGKFCSNEIPFFGLRDIDFKIQSNKINGAISDKICKIDGLEKEGLKFELQKVNDENFKF